MMHYSLTMERLRTDLLPRLTGGVFFTGYALYVAILQIREFLRLGEATALDDVIARAFVVTLFLLMAVSYWLRLPAKVKAVGFQERFFPFICAVLPVAVNEWGGAPSAGLQKILATSMLFAGNTIGVLSLVYLRRCFSIMAEVRELVARGPYRFVRHPIYLGQILSTGGLLLLTPSWLSGGLFALFVVLQLLRANFEEEKLTASLPEYKAYRQKTGAFWPRISL